MRLRHFAAMSLLTIACGTALPAAEPTSPPVSTDPVTLEPTERPLEQVLQWISRRANVNVVCNEIDQPKVTIRLVNVTWQEAVDQIAKKYGFVVEKRSDRLWQLTKPPLVRMELQDAPLVKVLEAIARQASVNIVIGSEIDATKKLTMVLSGVPWREALDVVVKSSGYAWVEQDYSIVRVVDRKSIKQDLKTQIFRLNNAAADDINKVISVQLKDDGSTIVDPRSNSIIVTASQLALDKTAATISSLDTRTRQVLIQVKFVDFSVVDAQRVGVDPFSMTMDVRKLGTFGFASSPLTLNNSLNSIGPQGTSLNSNDITGKGGLGRDSKNLPTTGGIGTLSANAIFEAVSALSSTDIIQAPVILTQDNVAAKLEIGSEVRFAETKQTAATNGGNPTVTVQEAASSPAKDGVKLNVTPVITADNVIIIKLEMSRDQLIRPFEVFGPVGNQIALPSKNTLLLNSTVMAKDGSTSVIGGILSNSTSEKDRKVPLLGDVPVLGWLFKSKEDIVEQRNLSIFITPRIVPIGQETEYDKSRAEQKSRLSGIKSAPATKIDSAQP